MVKKNFKIFFSGTKRPMILKLGMRHWFHVCYQSCSNDDTGLTVTYFIARSNLVLFVFVWKNAKAIDFQETIEAEMGWFVKKSIFSFLTALNLFKMQSDAKLIHLAIHVY